MQPQTVNNKHITQHWSSKLPQHPTTPSYTNQQRHARKSSIPQEEILNLIKPGSIYSHRSKNVKKVYQQPSPILMLENPIKECKCVSRKLKAKRIWGSQADNIMGRGKVEKINWRYCTTHQLMKPMNGITKEEISTSCSTTKGVGVVLNTSLEDGRRPRQNT